MNQFIEVAGTIINVFQIIFVQTMDLQEGDLYFGSENNIKLVIRLLDKTEISNIAHVDIINEDYNKLKRVLIGSSEVKENTTAEDSDVNQTSYGKKYHEASHLLTQIKNFLELNY